MQQQPVQINLFCFNLSKNSACPLLDIRGEKRQGVIVTTSVARALAVDFKPGPRLRLDRASDFSLSAASVTCWQHTAIHDLVIVMNIIRNMTVGLVAIYS